MKMRPSVARTPPGRQPTQLQAGPVFEYRGQTGLTTIGVVTGMRYRFDHPNARLHVHASDSGAMSGIPALRRIH